MVMKFIIGQKKGMTRIFDEEGRSVAVSIVKAMPCFVSAVKTLEKDGYEAIQIRSTKKVGGKERQMYSCEFRTKSDRKKGDQINLEQFAVGDNITVTGTSKGKGFAGTIKRYEFHRGPESHGGNNVREPGSIGGGYPQRVVKGRRMPGHMGHNTATVKNLTIINLDADTMLVSGAIPGPNKGIVEILSNSVTPVIAEDIVEDTVESDGNEENKE
jgi:large subunit ribosomal protein L3